MKNTYLILILVAIFTISCTRKSDSYVLPSPEDVVIYEVNPRVFAPEKSFNAVSLYLDSIKQLGANIVWFMPIFEIGKERSVNSPYCVKDYKAVNPEFGTAADFKNLVAKCHEKGLGVIIDWVPNHTSWDNAWIANKSWYTQDSTGAIIYPDGTGWKDVADLNYDNPDMRLEMIDAMKYWVTEMGVDGFRCDAVDFVPFDFLKQANDSLKKIPGHKLLMLAEGGRKDHFDAGFDLNYAWHFHNAMRNVFRNDSCATLLYKANEEEYADIPAGKRKLRFSTNHDEASKESPVKEWTNMRGSMAAYATAVLFPGCPMLYGSQEVGYPDPINFFKYTPVDWSSNNALRKEYEKITSIYNTNDALRKSKLKAYPDHDILLFERYSDNDRYLVAINVRNSAQSMPLPEGIAGKSFRNLSAGNDMKLSDTLSLKPYEYLILK